MLLHHAVVQHLNGQNSQFQPERKGKVTAIYDPKDRPGQFNKTLSVYTNTKPEVVVLAIKGEVTPHEKTVEELFTFPVGAVQVRKQSSGFYKC